MVFLFIDFDDNIDRKLRIYQIVVWSKLGSDFCSFVWRERHLAECVCSVGVRETGNVSALIKFFWILLPKILTFLVVLVPTLSLFCYLWGMEG